MTAIEKSMVYHLSEVSRNEKTGPIPVTTSSRETCPSSCAFRNNGCYAESGPMRFHWDRVTKGVCKDPLTLEDLCTKIKRFPKGQLWRHNQAGDLPGVGEWLDRSALRDLTQANKGRRGFTYTHKNVSVNLSALLEANHNGFTINASANTLDDADHYVSLGLPAVVVVPEDAPNRFLSPAGNRVTVCPAQVVDTTCASCGLCQKQTKGLPGGESRPRDIVAFRVHGIAKKKLLRTLRILETSC